ncbi:MAG: hypothetical protein NTZ05_06160 [Chloroflexi bacterium]|nr:hypothetical protein [Chloroflexota bacterium]
MRLGSSCVCAWTQGNVAQGIQDYPGPLAGKVGGVFTAGGRPGSGAELALAASINVLLNHGMVIQGNAYGARYGPVLLRETSEEEILCTCRGRGQGLDQSGTPPVPGDGAGRIWCHAGRTRGPLTPPRSTRSAPCERRNLVVRIRPLTKDEVTPEIRQAMEQTERALGKPLISQGIQAYCPPIFEASRALGSAPARSHTLPAQLRSLICVRVAQLAGCPF